MRRYCRWCGKLWEASKLEPDPYFCPLCADYESVWHALRKEAPTDASTAGETHPDARGK